MDPALHLVFRASLALLLASAAWHKLRDLLRFRTALAQYELLPAGFIAPAAVLAPALEAVLAAMIASSVGIAAAALASAALMLMYAAAIAVNLRRGRADIDCGCLGPASRVPLSNGLVARNLALVAAFSVLALPVSTRALTWLDLVGAAAGVAALSACWLATQRMLALAPRAALLRSSRR